MAANNEGFNKDNVISESDTSKKSAPKKKSKKKQRRSTKDKFVGDDVLVRRDDVLGQQSLAAMNRTKLPVPMPSEGTAVMATSSSIENHPWAITDIFLEKKQRSRSTKDIFVGDDVLGQQSVAAMNRPKLAVPMPSSEGTAIMATSTSIEKKPWEKKQRRRTKDKFVGYDVRRDDVLDQQFVAAINRPKLAVPMPSSEGTAIMATSTSIEKKPWGDDVLGQRSSAAINRPKLSVSMPSEGTTDMATSTSIENHPLEKKQRRRTKDKFLGYDMRQDDVLCQQFMAAINRPKLAVPMPSSEGTAVMATSTSIEKKPWGDDVLGQRSSTAINRPKLSVSMPSEGRTDMATSTSMENHPLEKKQRRRTKDKFVGYDVLGQQFMAAINRPKLAVPMPSSEGTAIMATSTSIEKKPWGDDVLDQRSLAAKNRPKLSVSMPSEGTTAMATSTSIENHPLVKAHKALQQAIAENENRSKPSGRMPSQKMSFVTTSSRERRPSEYEDRSKPSGRMPSQKMSSSRECRPSKYENRSKPSGRMSSQKMSSSRECRPSDKYVVPRMPFCRLEESCLVCGKKEFHNEDLEEFFFVAMTVEDILTKFIHRLNRKIVLDLICSEESEPDCPESLKTWSRRNFSILIGEVNYPETDEGIAEFWDDIAFLDQIPEIKHLSEEVKKVL